MTHRQYDLIVEVVHYSRSGEIDWVRAYERRGPTYSDRVILSRKDLIEKVKEGKKVFGGRRVPLLAGTFEIYSPIRLTKLGEKDILLSGITDKTKDCLPDVPII